MRLTHRCAAATMAVLAALTLGACTSAGSAPAEPTTSAAQPLGPTAGPVQAPKNCKPTTTVGKQLTKCEGTLIQLLNKNMDTLTLASTEVIGAWKVDREWVVAVSINGSQPLSNLEDTPRAFKFAEALNAAMPPDQPIQFVEPAWATASLTFERTRSGPFTHYVVFNKSRAEQLKWHGKLADETALLGYTYNAELINYELGITVSHMAGDAEWSRKLGAESAKNSRIEGAGAGEGGLGTEACQSSITVLAAGDLTQVPKNADSILSLLSSPQETWCISTGQAWTAFQAGYTAQRYQAMFPGGRGPYLFFPGRPYAVMMSETAYNKAAAAAR